MVRFKWRVMKGKRKGSVQSKDAVVLQGRAPRLEWTYLHRERRRPPGAHFPPWDDQRSAAVAGRDTSRPQGAAETWRGGREGESIAGRGPKCHDKGGTDAQCPHGAVTMNLARVTPSGQKHVSSRAKKKLQEGKGNIAEEAPLFRWIWGMRSWERVAYARLAVPCGIAAISLLLIAGRDHAIHNVGGGMRMGIQALPGELLVMPTSCIAMMRPSYSIQLAGGLLHVTNISFPDGLGGNGTAWASGVVNGKVVYGEVGLHGDAETEGNWTEGGGKEFGADDEDVRLYNRTRSGHGLDPIDAQYQTAIRQVVGNMKSRTTAMASDAKKIAKAVTKVLTSSAVSSTIADMAWNLAEKKYKDDNSMMTPAEIEQAATVETPPQIHRS